MHIRMKALKLMPRKFTASAPRLLKVFGDAHGDGGHVATDELLFQLGLGSAAVHKLRILHLMHLPFE